MRRIVLIVPGLLGEAGAESPLRQNLPALTALAEIGSLAKLAPLPKVETPEALYLGMRPDEAQMPQGPLTVSALGADPPERSIHFHVSRASFDGEVLSPPGAVLTEEEDRILMAAAKRLQTPTLTLVEGEGWDHGLVWEARADLGTTRIDEAYGKPMRSVLPEGDGEPILRRFIDDSINLLTDLEANQRRIDQGLPPVNVLWPWGHGMRRPVPNLFLRRGERAVVESGSLRLAGLTRLSGYVHEDRSAFGRGTRTRLADLARRALGRDLTIALIEAPGDFRSRGMEEELHWIVREIDRELLSPILEASRLEPTRLVLAGTGPEGLVLEAIPARPAVNAVPYDERALEERTLPRRDLWQVVSEGVTL